MRRFLRIAARTWIVRLGFFAASLLPIRRRVVLATSHLAQIDGNLACVRAEMARRTPPIPVTVFARRPERGMRGRLRMAINALAAGYHLATTRLFIVDDYFFPLYVIRPRAGTTVVQTWHACGAFKKFGYSTLEKEWGADEGLTSRVRIHSNYDLCLVSSRAAAPSYAEAFRQPLERFVSHLGIPRTDLLFGAARLARTSERIRSRYALREGQRVVLYAPTFRGDNLIDARHPEGLDFRLLERVLGNDHVFLVRLHPFVRSRLRIDADLARFVIDVSGHPEVNELLPLSDVLVTDYSSVIFEYALLGRPIAFFAPDHEAYERERGFYFDFRTGVPGPIFETTEQLARYLRAGRFDTRSVDRFAGTWFDVADGHASERFVDRVVLPALSGGLGSAA